MIKFERVGKAYRKDIGVRSCKALNDLTFAVRRGEVFGLIGANGAGKSTSIKLLMDFIRPDHGTIEVLGGSPGSVAVRQKIGYLPEIANFPANLSPLDLLRFTATTCNLDGNSAKSRTKEILLMLDLWEVRKRPLRTYSKGMQQRASFAIALLNDPELLILDEPMSGLDPIGRKKVIDLILRLKNEGKTMILCSHILEDVDRLADRILLLHKGYKLFLGTPTEFVVEEESPSIAEAFVRRVAREDGDAL